MKAISKTFSIILGFILLGGLGVGGYFALVRIVELFARMDSQVATVTATASVVALLAAKIIASSIREAGKHSKAQPVHAEKVATYQQLIEAWKDVLQHEWSPDLESPDMQSEDLQALECLLVLHSSSGVVKAYGALQALATKPSSQSLEVVSQFATVLLEMRKDLGSDTQGLQAEDLLQLLRVDARNSSERPKAQPYQDHCPRVSLASNP